MEQLREADVRLQVALARIGEMHSRVESLEGEMNDQLRLRTLEEEIRWLKSVITSKNLFDVQNQINEQKKLLDEYNKASKRLNNDISESDLSLERIEKERKDFVSNVLDSSGGQRVELEFSIGRMKSEIQSSEEDILEAKKIVAKIESSIPLLNNLRNKREKEIISISQEISEKEQKMIELESLKIDSENRLKKLSSKLSRNKALVSKSRLKEKRINERLVNYNEKLNDIIRRIDINENRKLTNNERLRLLNEKSGTFLSTLDNLEDQLKKLEDLASIESNTLEKLGISLRDITEREGMMQDEVVRALSILNKASSTLLKYETQRSVAEQLSSGEIGLKRLEDFAKTGALEGFIGRLDSLVTFAPKYESAILSAGHRWLKGIIVKDLKAMLKIAEAAKRFKIQKITIIPLSEVVNSKRIRLPKSSGYIGNLADFIKTNNQYHGLINFLFGDTILVNDSSDGFKISSQGFKTVTLSGDLFENRSTIFETGYSLKLDEILSLVHDEASLSIVKEALKTLQKTISKRKVDIDQLQSESKKLTNERLNRKIMVERIKAETLTVNNFIRKYRSLEKDIKDQTKQYHKKGLSVNNRINVLRKYLETTNKKINNLKEQLQNMKMEELQSDIASSEKEKNAMEQLAESTSRNLRDVVTQLTRDKANLEHNLKPSFLRIKEQIENSEEILSEKQKFILESKGILAELSEKLKLLKKSERETIVKTKKSRPLLEKFDRRINNLKKKRDNLIRSGSNIEKEILSTSKNIEILYGSIKNLRGELSLYGYDKPVAYFEMADSLLNQMNIEYKNLKNNVNLLAINSYQEIYSGYKNLSIRRNQLESERDAVVRFIEEVEAEKRHVFITSFEKIDKELRTIFAKLTGGSAWMELEDSDDIFSKGVFLMTQFPGKLPRESSSVSGGEKTVSALSMILAIQSVYPSPFYIFDEIDAHLDARNSEKLADLLKERAESSQIIAVTLKDTILARANLVYGIYMEKGQSKIIKYRSNMEVLAISGK